MNTPMTNKRILVVDDEPSISSLVDLYLSKEGFAVSVEADGAKALEAIKRFDPALVVLDLMLPGADGLEICKAIRSRGDVPIIMLTARDADVDKIVGIELGADDYVTKPFNPRELVARVKAVLRRSGRPAGPGPSSLSVGEITIDVGRRTVTTSHGRVDLTAKEFDLLAYLAGNAGIVLGRSKLLEEVWGYERAFDSRTVDSHIRSLRSKLGSASGVLKTVRGVGYKADEP